MNGYDPDFSPPRRNPLVLFFAILASFAAGAMLDRVGFLPGSASAPHGLGRTFREAWDIAEAHYVDREKINPENMTEGAIEGMLASLGDVGHTTYLIAEDVKRLESSIQGEMEGIGAHVSMRKGRPTVILAMPNTPADKAGLKAGDAIVDVDGKPTAGMSLQQTVSLVRGPKGTPVKLTILREGETKPLEITVTREKINIPQVTWHQLPGTELAHLGIHEFGKNADEELKKAIAAIREQKLKGIVLDVRGNPGGLKDQAVAVTSEFLSGGNVFIEQNAKGQRKPVPVKPDGVATDIPLCLLIDEGTASSAEILAGAIQDHKRAQLVGTHTFGTGTVLQPFPLSDGSAVLLAVLEWLTPDGRQIWHHGIEPNVEVAMPRDAAILLPEMEDKLTPEELHKTKDVQLLKAIEVLQK